MPGLLDLVRGADTAALSAVVGDGLRLVLAGFLDRVDDLLGRAADALDAEHFSHQMPQRTVFTPNDPGIR